MMTAIRKRAGDFAAVMVLFLVAVGVGGYILANQRLRFPFIEEKPFQLQAAFSTAQAVTPGQGQTIRMAGVRIGDISKVKLDNGRAIVTMDLDPEYDNLVHTDAKALLRPKTGLKDMFTGLPVDRFSQLEVHRWTGNVDPKLVPAQSRQRKYRLCTHPWSIFVITWSGEVVACCRDFESAYVVGAVDGEQGIMDIWNSQEMESLRRTLAKRRPQEIGICSDCDRPFTGGSVARSKPEMIKKILWERIASS